MSASLAWTERLEELEDQLEALSRSNDKLNAQVGKLVSDQDTHCHTVGAVYHNVTALLTTTGNLSAAHARLDETVSTKIGQALAGFRSQLMESHVLQSERLEGQVRRVLENFKEELVSQTQQTTAVVRQLQDRVDAFHDRMVRIEEGQRALRTEHNELATHVRHHVEAKVGQIDKEVSVGLERWERTSSQIAQTCNRLDETVRVEMAQRVDALHDDVQQVTKVLDQSREETSTVLNRVVKRVQEHGNDLTAVKQEQKWTRDAIEGRLGASLQQTLTSLERSAERIDRLEGHVTAAQRDLLLFSARGDEVARTLASHSDHVKEQARATEAAVQQSVAEQVKKMESDLDKRHRKLVESMHQALGDLSKTTDGTPAILSTLQQEVHAIRDALHHHSVAIDAQRMEGNLDSAFTELKDWLQDVERRMIGRSEVEDMLSAVTSQLHTFKQHTLSAEALLGQRLDAERSARENDVSHQSAQLNKLQTVLRR